MSEGIVRFPYVYCRDGGEICPTLVWVLTRKQQCTNHKNVCHRWRNTDKTYFAYQYTISYIGVARRFYLSRWRFVHLPSTYPRRDFKNLVTISLPHATRQAVTPRGATHRACFLPRRSRYSATINAPRRGPKQRWL